MLTTVGWEAGGMLMTARTGVISLVGCGEQQLLAQQLYQLLAAIRDPRDVSYAAAAAVVVDCSTAAAAAAAAASATQHQVSSTLARTFHNPANALDHRLL
jgi:hypothetical protein